jgi:putative transposase
MPPRGPIDPQGIYHVGSRGTYGRPLFRTPGEHELFLELYERTARKYGWRTLAWTLMKNHHHFVIRLTKGELSQGMREIHGGYSRRIHAIYGQTRKGHLFRHGFFARLLRTERSVTAACAYVDLNPSSGRSRVGHRRTDWCGLAATLGRAPRRSFHFPEDLLALLGEDVARARDTYGRLLAETHRRRRAATSPNDSDEPET